MVAQIFDKLLALKPRTCKYWVAWLQFASFVTFHQVPTYFTQQTKVILSVPCSLTSMALMSTPALSTGYFSCGYHRLWYRLRTRYLFPCPQPGSPSHLDLLPNLHSLLWPEPCLTLFFCAWIMVCISIASCCAQKFLLSRFWTQVPLVPSIPHLSAANSSFHISSAQITYFAFHWQLKSAHAVFWLCRSSQSPTVLFFCCLSHLLLNPRFPILWS